MLKTEPASSKVSEAQIILEQTRPCDSQVRQAAFADLVELFREGEPRKQRSDGKQQAASGRHGSRFVVDMRPEVVICIAHPVFPVGTGQCGQYPAVVDRLCACGEGLNSGPIRRGPSRRKTNLSSTAWKDCAVLFRQRRWIRNCTLRSASADAGFWTDWSSTVRRGRGSRKHVLASESVCACRCSVQVPSHRRA